MFRLKKTTDHLAAQLTLGPLQIWCEYLITINRQMATLDIQLLKGSETHVGKALFNW